MKTGSACLNCRLGFNRQQQACSLLSAVLVTQFSLDRFHWSLAVGLLRSCPRVYIPALSRVLHVHCRTCLQHGVLLPICRYEWGRKERLSTSRNKLGGVGRNRPEVVMTGHLPFVRDLLCTSLAFSFIFMALYVFTRHYGLLGMVYDVKSGNGLAGSSKVYIG